MQLPPPVHGAAQMNTYVAESELLKSSFDLIIINLQFARSIEELRKKSFRKVYTAFLYVFQIFSGLLKNRPDIVYFTLAPIGSAFYRDAFYLFVTKLFTNKTVIHLHGQGVKEGANVSKLSKYIYKRVFQNTSVICLSKNLVKDLEGVYGQTPYIVPNGIRVDHNIQPGLSKTPIPNILFLSNYRVLKGILLLLDALQSLKGNGEVFTASLVGSPGDLSIDDLQKHVEKRGLGDRVNVLGPLYGDDKKTEFLNSDIFVFPTLFEAFGLVNLEAMQFGLPVVSSIEGAIPDVILDGKTGLLIRPGDVEDLKVKLTKLLRDPDLRQNMGTAGRRRFLQLFTVEQFERNLKNVFEKVLDPTDAGHNAQAPRSNGPSSRDQYTVISSPSIG
jgi:glycosyltransferase involved in cell wall biosynthesis